MGRLKKARKRVYIPDPAKWPPSFKLGWFTALKIRLEEAAINNVVLRVPIKRHLNQVNQGVKRKRGRPHSTVKNVKYSKVNSALVTRRTKQSLLSDKCCNNLSTTRQLTQTKSSAPVKLKSVGKGGTKNRVNNCHKPTPLNNIVSGPTNFVQCVPLQSIYSKLTLDFAKLEDLVVVMKLPSPTWKVTVMLNHDLTKVFKFVKTNPPKSVTFSETNPDCNIVIAGVPVILLGCPATIDCLRDIEILLEIVNRLDLMDCMVFKS